MAALEWTFNLLVNLYAILGMVPFLVFPLVGLAAYVLGNDKKTSVRLAADITTFFLIGTVSVLYNQVISAGIDGKWIVLFIFLLLTGLIGSAQNQIRGKVNPQKLLRAVWRLGFLILVVIGSVLMIVEVIKNLIT